MKKYAQLALGLAMALLFGWLAVRHIQFAQLLAILQQTRWGWVVLALGVFCLGYACRIERWRIMLSNSNARLRWRDAAGPLMASFAANNVLPFRAGDVMRAFAFQRELGVAPPAVLATLLSERLLDFLLLLVLLALGLYLLQVNASSVMAFGFTTIFIAIAAILTLTCAPKTFEILLNALFAVLQRLSPAITAKLRPKAQQVMDTLHFLSRGNTMFKLLGWSSLAWICEGLVFWCTAKSLPGLSQPIAAWLALPVGTLSTLIPGTPGYVGTFDFFVQRAMMSLGNPLTAAAAFAFLVHFVVWLPPTLLGGLYFFLRPKAPSTLARNP